MSIIGTYFRKEELSIISPFVSQRLGKETGPVATVPQVSLHYLFEREKMLNKCYF